MSEHAGEKVEPRELRTIVDLYLQGMNSKQIGARVGRTANAVHILIFHRVAGDYEEEGLRGSPIKKLVGERSELRRGRVPTIRDVKYYAYMRRAGRSLTECQIVLHLTPSAVKKLRDDLEHKRKPPEGFGFTH